MKPELFFFPASFYSQKARLALEWKGIAYSETLISLKDNEQGQAWFLKLNPNGEVPALRIGDQTYNESENIINIVDNLPSGCKDQLVPKADTPFGQKVDEWRTKLDAVPVPTMSFGVLSNPDLGQDLSAFPAFLRMKPEGVKARFQKSIEEFKLGKQKHPEMSELYDKKIAGTSQRLTNFFDRSKVVEVLDGVDVLMGEIEQQLKETSKGNPRSVWLCGASFSAADINLCVLLGRVTLLGLSSRFINADKYPLVAKYWENAKERPAVQKVVVNNMSEVKKIYMCRAARKYGGIAVGLGVVGAAVWIGYKQLQK